MQLQNVHNRRMLFTTADGIEILDRPLRQPEDELEPEPQVRSHGGAREGAGRPAKGFVKPKASTDYDLARARNELAKAELNELDVKVKTGEYGSRAQFRQASATAIAALAQTLRSIPDNLERKLGVTPEVASEVSVLIDNALNDLASEFEMMTSQHAPK
ncbi:terminase small subunit [Curvibacter phage PCA1]|nr:terminase small subunit [Curvibacter phage PCA1]